MERDLRPADAPGGERGQQLRREMEPGRRGRGRAARAGEDRLIPLDVSGRLVAAPDVAWQRHAASPHEHRFGRLIARRSCEPRAAAGPAHEREFRCVAARAIDEHDPLAESRPTAGLREHPPTARLFTLPLHLQKKPLPAAARGGPAAHQPGGHHAGVVDHDQVAGGEQVGQVANLPVLERAGAAAGDEQPGRRPVGQRLLGDEFPRQVVVVEVGVGHAQIVAGSDRDRGRRAATLGA